MNPRNPWNPRTVSKVLNLVALSAAVGAIAACLAGWLLPYSHPRITPVRPIVNPQRSGQQIPPLSAFDTVVRLDLRRPLSDVAVLEEKNIAPPPVRLTGTIVEPGEGNSKAIFQTNDGQIELKSVGDKAGGADILEINEESVTLLYHGRKITLQRQQEGKS